MQQAETLKKDLERIGGMLNRWRAELVFCAWTSAAIAGLWLFAILDVFLQFGRWQRVATWAVLVVLVGIASHRSLRALMRRRTLEGIAATVERAFPRLDNRLINLIQFSGEAGGDLFRKAYVEQGVPQWREIDPRGMKSRREHRRQRAILAGALLLVALPLCLSDRVWPAALWRIVNPFSDRKPVCLTTILSVTPGNATAVQGSPLTLECEVRGKRGHRVWLDIRSSDGQRSTYDLGRLTSGAPQGFQHRIAAVTTGMDYRFLAGDDAFPTWFSIETRPPLAVTRIDVTVRPPAYTRLRERTFNGTVDTVEIPEGSEVEVALMCNAPPVSAGLRLKGGKELLPLAADEPSGTWRRTVTTNAESIDKVVAVSAYGEQAEVGIGTVLMRDKPPTIQVAAPKGRALLRPGASPAIEFSAHDDYGLGDITLERIGADGTTNAAGGVVGKWTGNGQREFAVNWSAERMSAGDGRPLAFRLTAMDNCPFAEHAVRSAPIVFDVPAPEETNRTEAAKYAEALALLSRITGMQRTNLQSTVRMRDAVDRTPAGAWHAGAEQQKQIRQLTRDLLNNPLEPLGGLAAAMKALYAEEMQEVIAKLTQVAAAQGAAKRRLADGSIALEEKILRILTSADVAVDKTRYERSVSGLFALLDRLIKGENKVIAETDECARQSAAAPKALAERQDDLASDVVAFVAACGQEAKVVEAHDPKLAELISKTAQACEASKVKADMLRAAELLEKNEPKNALPYEQSALAKLERLRTALDQWQVASAAEHVKEAGEALHEANERLRKLERLESSVMEAMRLTEVQKDRSDAEKDLLADEIEETQKNIRDALLEIARDLHIYPELSVANELVEDVYSVFEEVTQVAGSENMTAEDAQEMGVLKPEEILEQMKKAEGRIDEMEMWLGEKPDSIKFNNEPFDREEMPKMALGALPASIEDLIGDLLKEQQSLAEAADDSGTNLGMPEPPPPGWEVAEGPIESFGAQGKSGNQVPDHKEQSGRSIVGRQGQAIGETAAGSGTISEGDKNIEKRITPEPLQSGQVQADGKADEIATGGGKQASGAADSVGMPGAGSNRRMDSTAKGSLKGLESLMAKTEAVHIKASTLNLRTESLGAAAHHMRQANDAIAAGLPISEAAEHQKRAITALKKARTELTAGVGVELQSEQGTRTVDDVVTESSENAPAAYRDLVTEYFKSLSESP